MHMVWTYAPRSPRSRYDNLALFHTKELFAVDIFTEHGLNDDNQLV